LNKLLAEQTKSRQHRCNDNGLVKSKDAAVIRKHMGYGYIAASHALGMMTFYREHLNPYPSKPRSRTAIVLLEYRAATSFGYTQTPSRLIALAHGASCGPS